MSSILIVDHEKDLVRRCQDELTSGGHEVAAVFSADAALQWLSHNEADLVIVDLELSGGQGLDLLAQILHKRRDTRILVHTARPCYRDDFTCWGADAFVMKAGDSSSLLSAVAALLRKAA